MTVLFFQHWVLFQVQAAKGDISGICFLLITNEEYGLFNSFTHWNFLNEAVVYVLSHLAHVLWGCWYKNYTVAREEVEGGWKMLDTSLWSQIPELGGTGEKWWVEQQVTGSSSLMGAGCSLSSWGASGLYGPVSACTERALCSQAWSFPGLLPASVLQVDFLISAPWRVKMAEPHNQGWRDTLWPVKQGGEERTEAMSKDTAIFVATDE